MSPFHITFNIFKVFYYCISPAAKSPDITDSFTRVPFTVALRFLISVYFNCLTNVLNFPFYIFNIPAMLSTCIHMYFLFFSFLLYESLRVSMLQISLFIIQIFQFVDRFSHILFLLYQIVVL